MRALVIVNPVAGRGQVRENLPALRRKLEAALPGSDLVLTEASGHAERLAREAAEAKYERVVAVGGDGTVGEVLNGLAGSGTALGVVPIGTGNDLARNLGIPCSLAGGVAYLRQAVRRRIDLGEESERLFGVIVGVGFAAEVMRRTNLRRGAAKGSAAILLSILQTLAALESFPARLVLDGRPAVEGPLEAVFVMNTRTTGGGLMLCPDADPADGWLDVCVMGDFSRLGLLAVLPKAYSGRHVGHPKVRIFRARSVRLETDRPLVKMFDGDLFGDAPLEARIRPAALDVLVPAEGFRP